MNTFNDIWNNPKERLDFIIALIVCALFGIGILFFLPQSSSLASQEDNLSQNESTLSSIESASLLAKDSEETTRTYSKKILTDKDLEGKEKRNSFFQKNKPLDSTKTTSTHNQSNTNKQTNNLDTSSPQPKKTDVVKKKTNDVKKLSLDSLKTTDFQKLEQVDEIAEDSSKDLGNSTNKNVDELVAIKKDSLEGMDKNSIIEKIPDTKTSNESLNLSKDTNSDESSKNTSNKSIVNSNNNKNSSPINNNKAASSSTPSNSKKDDISYQLGDCIIVVGAFEKDVNAKKIIRQLKRKGYTVKTGWRKGLKYVGVPIDCKKDKMMQNTLQQLRKTFDIEAWVLKP